MKIVIIGGTAGGAGIAARLRRLDENLQISIIEKNSYISWAGCALPYFTGGLIPQRSSLFLANKEMFYQRFRIEVIENTQAIGLDRQQKAVIVTNSQHSETEPRPIHYDQLIIATGAEAILPPFAQNRNQDGIFTMRSVEDAENVRNFIKEHNVTSSVIVGGGFIGLETCENLLHLGLKVTLIEKAPQVLTPVDFDIAHYLHRELDQSGVSLKLGIGIKDIPARNANGDLQVILENGEIISTKLVIMSLGVRPASGFLANSGLTLNERGYVPVDDTLQTADPHIFALGDVASVTKVDAHHLGAIALAGPASKQARVLASNIILSQKHEGKALANLPEAHHYHGALGTSIVRVLNLAAGSIGANRRQLLQQGYTSETLGEVTVHTPNHVSWLSPATPVHLKVLFDKQSGLILGAQAVGEASVDKNIEVISAFMQKNGTVYDMVDFESAYAPPFSAPRSPVNMAGSTAVNVLEGMEESINCEQLADLDDDRTIFLDVRTPEEFSLGSIPRFVNVPVDMLRTYLHEHPIDPRNRYVVTCQVGVRGHTAACILRHEGANKVMNLSGGYLSWAMLHYKLQH